MASLMPPGKQQYFTANGVPLAGGKLYTYAAGTTSLLSTYQDKSGGTPNTNPVILDSRGEASVFWGSAGYKAVLKDSTDVTIWTQDNLYAVQDSSSMTFAQQLITAIAGQTLFNLSVSYAAGTNSLCVYCNGLRLNSTDYVETSTTSVTMNAAATVGDEFLFVVGDFAASTTGADLITYVPAGAGAVTTTVQAKLRESVSVKDFGAVGDDSDESTKLQSALTAAAGGVLLLEPGKTYRSSEALVMQPSTVLALNGSTLRFACIGAKRNLAVASGCEVINGTVENVVGSAGFEGTYQTPIVVGQYTTLAGVSNVLLQNLTISTVLAQGNGIAIFGDSHNITIDNIKFPDSNKIGIPILAHWSFNGGPTGPYTGTTTHPHNIKISNIHCGELTYNAGAAIFGTSVIFLSAVYNVEVSNVYAKNMQYGKLLTVYAGDWGFQFGTALEQTLGLGSISAVNLYGKALIGAQVYNKNPLEAIKKVWPGSVVISNANVSGISANSESKGARIEVSDNVRVSSSVFDGFYQGVYVGSETTEFAITDSTIRNSARSGYQIDGTTGVSKLTIDACRFASNNTGVAGSTPDVYCANAAGVVVRGCEFNSANAAWSVRAENTVTRLRLVDNHVVSVGAGAAFSLGAQTDVNICIQYQGNTSAVSPANGVRGGQLMIPALISTKHGTSSDQARISYYTTSPDRGTWAIGDRVLNATPAVGQPKGWICIVAGTPGTWVSEGNL